MIEGGDTCNVCQLRAKRSRQRHIREDSVKKMSCIAVPAWLVVDNRKGNMT